MKHGHHWQPPLIALILLALPAWTAAGAQSAAGAPTEAYGYFRTVEGRSLLSSREPEETRDLEINLPILAGDAVQVGGGSRVEAVLADGSVVRLEAGAELVFDQLARSPDSPGASSSRLVLLAGEMQIRVPDETAETTPVEIETSNARVYLIRGGSFWVGSAGGDETRLVVREGAAEVLTDEGSYLVQAGEEVAVSGAWGVETRVARAGYERDIERWARELERAAYIADYGQVAEPLHYAAAPLARSGSWVRVDGRVAWRPRVRYGWRPFTEGYWVYTPSGLSWVASAPWGYVTSHYGTWDYLPSYGWCWFPGSVYSPAWVYWYWGPSHVAWVPYGYYARHYGPRYGVHWSHHGGFGLRFGVYGYASGGWSVFADWTFCPLGYFGRRGGRYYYRSGTELAHARRALAVPRGIITTDTRGLDRAVWTRPYEARRRLGEIHRGTVAKDRYHEAGDLPDVTAFVARRRELPTDLHSLVKPLADGDKRPAPARIGSPAVQSVDRVTGRPAAPAAGVAPGRAVGRVFGSGDEARGVEPSRGAPADGRFERKPSSRPTEFEQAPTTVYSSPGVSRRVDAPSARQSVPGSARPGLTPAGKLPVRRPDESLASGGEVRGERPTVFERAPTAVYGKPGSAPPPEVRRPPAASGSRDARPGGEPLLRGRSPLGDARDRALTPIYSRPAAPSGAAAIGRRPMEVRPPAAASPSGPSSGSRVGAPPPPARRVIESVRSRIPSSPSQRLQPPPSRPSGSSVRGAPSAPSASRGQSSVRSSGRSGDTAARSRSTARKKDD